MRHTQSAGMIALVLVMLMFSSSLVSSDKTFDRLSRSSYEPNVHNGKETSMYQFLQDQEKETEKMIVAFFRNKDCNTCDDFAIVWGELQKYFESNEDIWLITVNVKEADKTFYSWMKVVGVFPQVNVYSQNNKLGFLSLNGSPTFESLYLQIIKFQENGLYNNVYDPIFSNKNVRTLPASKFLSYANIHKDKLFAAFVRKDECEKCDTFSKIWAQLEILFKDYNNSKLITVKLEEEDSELLDKFGMDEDTLFPQLRLFFNGQFWKTIYLYKPPYNLTCVKGQLEDNYDFVYYKGKIKQTKK